MFVFNPYSTDERGQRRATPSVSFCCPYTHLIGNLMWYVEICIHFDNIRKKVKIYNTFPRKKIHRPYKH